MVKARDQEAVKILRRGGIGVYPTDTLYGVVGKASSKKAVERIYKVKGRNKNKPLIILISSPRDLEKFVIAHALIRTNGRIIQKVWPGPVSIIFPCSNKKLHYLHRGTKSLAFRLPKNKKLRAFLKRVGPLVAPSANPQSLKPAETITQAKKYFGEQLDFYVSGGRKIGKPSAVISLLGSKPKIIREGNLKIPIFDLA